MRWFEDPNSGPAPTAKFADVTTRKAKTPSWLSGSSPAAAAIVEAISLHPPRLPNEFIDAIRMELDPEVRATPENALERPSALPGASLPAPPPAEAAYGNADAARDVRGAGLHARSYELPRQPSVPEEFVPSPEVETAFLQAIAQLTDARARVIEQTAGQLAELAATIAQRVIAHELSINREVVVTLVQEGLNALGETDRVLVRLGRGFESTRDILLGSLVRHGRQAEVRIDPTLGDFGCIVETELGWVDESIERRLATMLHALKPETDSSSTE